MSEGQCTGDCLFHVFLYCSKTVRANKMMMMMMMTTTKTTTRKVGGQTTPRTRYPLGCHPLFLLP